MRPVCNQKLATPPVAPGSFSQSALPALRSRLLERALCEQNPLLRAADGQDSHRRSRPRIGDHSGEQGIRWVRTVCPAMRTRPWEGELQLIIVGAASRRSVITRLGTGCAPAWHALETRSPSDASAKHRGRRQARLPCGGGPHEHLHLSSASRRLLRMPQTQAVHLAILPARAQTEPRLARRTRKQPLLRRTSDGVSQSTPRVACERGTQKRRRLRKSRIV
ncbi:hypothetical protein OH76DRAFT_993850 [Lentinus brumalis]|uniref:Uncharacterized protein n=1 Tax=Lentinus brumalis TaxID=2498619 RepID=A0A371DQE7_9APHY|nr:hypothetical protein OH76DRAFT_993850 [Polyporus brumalis]